MSPEVSKQRKTESPRNMPEIPWRAGEVSQENLLHQNRKKSREIAKHKESLLLGSQNPLQRVVETRALHIPAEGWLLPRDQHPNQPPHSVGPELDLQELRGPGPSTTFKAPFLSRQQSA